MEETRIQRMARLLSETWPARMAKDAWQAVKLPGDVYQGNVPITGEDGRTNPEVINRAADLAGILMGGTYGTAPAGAVGVGAVKPIRAYHGSPHDFDKFDISKIGTGEGAQAYGHGLYFAEKEGVAKAYRDDLTKARVSAANRMLAKYGGDIDAAMAAIRTEIDRLKNLPNAGNDAVRRDAFIALNETKLAELSALKQSGAMSKGRMYEVDIHASPERFLDWDKPLSEQPDVYRKLAGLPQFHRQQAMLGDDRLASVAKENGIPPLVAIKVQSELASGVPLNEAFEKVRGMSSNPDWAALTDKLAGLVGEKVPTVQTVLPGDWTGRAFAKDIPGMTPDSIANTLREAGIPGIKYLDAGSRGAGDGSRNYVVFDDSIVEILKKYGLAGLLPAAGMGLPPVQQQYE